MAANEDHRRGDGSGARAPFVRPPARYAPRPAERLVAACAWVQRHAPRGKAWFPRQIGAALCRGDGAWMATRHGARLFLARNAFDVYATMRLNGRAWDYHDFEIALALTPDGGVFYDVGANVGYESVEMSRVKAPGTRVYAFEPDPRLASAIALSAAENGFADLHVVSALVGDAEGEHDFHLAASTIHASAVGDLPRNPKARRRIPMVTIDGLVDGGAMPPPDAVKMDVEGSEYLVFRGAAAAFRASRPHIFLEYISYEDVGARQRTEIERLMADVPDYALYGYPSLDHAHRFEGKLFAIADAAEWDLVHGLVLRNRARPVADESLFPAA